MKRELSGVLRAASDPTRRAVLDLLGEGERSVSELQKSFRISQPALSQHLRVLREAGLVSQRQEGRFRLYRLEAAALREIHDWVAHYERFWSKKLDRLGDYLEKNP
ncbi:MAG: winged helix-turn-helix transcriptional regulator [Gemmatimonadetes bacterium]|nr:winged helix-turn-helix transcriptional regulator [Gemmatimonadota bacterium]